MKLAPDDLRGVAETLLVPLAYRDDPMSKRFRDAIDYDWHKFTTGSLQHASMVARTEILDDIVGAFVRDNRGGLVANMGAGLDTRFHRLDDGTVQWLEVDLPEVIALRERLGEPANPRHALFAGSILDGPWLDQVRRRSAPAIMFVAEGLLPYFTEPQHREIFATLAENFPGEEIVFQTSAPSIITKLAPKSDLSKLRSGGAELRWGLEEGRDVEQLDPRVRFVEERSLSERFPNMMPPGLSKDELRRAAKVVHARFV
jgi:O-methyltransferase involved in polyketide biosynthesis